MSAFVAAEVETVELNAALHDARFARTMLWSLGLLISGSAFYLGAISGMIFGALTIACGFYFVVWKIPALEEELRASRFRLARSIERLGQSANYGCE